jgi:hypothetical protein
MKSGKVGDNLSKYNGKMKTTDAGMENHFIVHLMCCE